MNNPQIDIQSMLDSTPGLYSVADTQRRICEAASSWLEARYHESPIIVALPKINEIPWYSVFNWNRSDVDAERILTKASGDGQCLGINQHNFVESAYLLDAPRFNQSLVAAMINRGWTEEQIDSVPQAEVKADDIRHRMRGAAGWMICQPAFLEERNALLEFWNQLAERNRPELPLHRAIESQQQPEGTRQAKPSKRIEFQRMFDEFCDGWRLLGMITWDLPKMDGPKWTNAYPGRPETREGMTCHDTPFHFPLLTQDGLGEVAGEEHNRLAEAHGFNDQSKWQTYAQLLRMSFWESVIDQRYANYDRVKGFVTKKLEVLAVLLDLDVERTKKLRTLSKKLKAGQKADLSKHR